MSRTKNKARRGRGGGAGGGRGGRPSHPAPTAGVRGNYSDIPQNNEGFEKYYRDGGLIPPEEWEEFWAALKRTLPTTFRFTGSKGHALQVVRTLKETYIPHMKEIVWDGEKAEPPVPIPWFPDNLAWCTTVPKTVIRRCPPFKEFQNFLVGETTVGNISRQEAVSMIPPLLMDIDPHHVVLDMCAAPGSKTAQLIEAIHSGEEDAMAAAYATSSDNINLSEHGEDCGRPTGLVIANDADYKRSHMLVHQTKRLNSPNIIVMNHDATAFPSLLTSAPGEQKKQYLKFDRILADVPCSGDGTARKNYSVWRDWNPNSAFNLHLTQVRILIRGLQMLKVGGRLIYSTCSMNPIENEAVVASAISRCGGLDKVQIVDVGDRLPDLTRKPGLKSGWKVMDRDHTWYSSYEEVVKEGPGKEGRLLRIVRSMFPSEDGKADDDETRVPLERCLRIYPHLQDTGGFFIAVLEKRQEIGAITPEESRKRQNTRINVQKADESPAAEVSIEETKVSDEIATPPSLADQATTEPTQINDQPPSPGKRRLDSPIPAPSKKLKADGIPNISAPTHSPVHDTTPNPTPNPTEKRKKGPPPEEPFKFLPSHNPVLQQIYAFYNLSPRFPRNCFMVRNEEAKPARAIYFTSQLARKVLIANEGKGCKFVHCGVKAFMKQDTQNPETCPWRIQNEGLGIISPWIGEERVVRCRQRNTVHALLKELFPLVADGEGGEKSLISEIGERVKGMDLGCCVLRCEKDEGSEGFEYEMTLPLWKSRATCNLMLPKDERKAMLLRMFNDTEEIKDSTNKNQVKKGPPKTDALEKAVSEEAREGKGRKEGKEEHQQGADEDVDMEDLENLPTLGQVGDPNATIG